MRIMFAAKLNKKFNILPGTQIIKNKKKIYTLILVTLNSKNNKDNVICRWLIKAKAKLPDSYFFFLHHFYSMFEY